MATFTIKRGDSWGQYFPLQDKATGALISLIDNVGPPIIYAEAKMDVRHKTTLALAFSLDSTDGLTVEEFTVKVDVSATNSALLNATKYVFDIEVTFADGTVRSTLPQYFDVEQDYTYV